MSPLARTALCTACAFATCACIPMQSPPASGEAPTSMRNQAPGDLCTAPSTTKPEPLEGKSQADDYAFTFRSDVDEKGEHRSFVASIRNDRKDAYLPAEWVRSDKTVEISFKRIAPEGCAANLVETSVPAKEDAGAMIHYDPTKRQSQKAPLFIQDPNAPPAPPANVGPALTSSVTADIEDAEGEPRRLHLEFSTLFEGTHLRYTIVSKGARNEMFSIPELVEVLGRERLDWPREGPHFVATREAAPLVFNLPPGTTLRERVVTLTLWENTDTEIGRARVAVYLPVRNPDR